MKQTKLGASSSDPVSALEALIVKTASSPVTAREMAGYIHALLVTGGDSTRRDAKKSNPRGNMTNASKTEQELVRVAKAAEALKDALKNMSGPAASTFTNVDTLITQSVTVAIIARAAIASAGDMAKAFVIPPLSVSPQEQLAATAAFVFLMLTGVEPTRRTKDGKAYGPFLDFLSTVFAARRMAASPESCTRAALRIMERSRVKQGPNLHS